MRVGNLANEGNECMWEWEESEKERKRAKAVGGCSYHAFLAPCFSSPPRARKKKD